MLTKSLDQSGHYHMKARRHIRHCLGDQTASLIAHALISSCLDYANSVLLGSPNFIINKLQHIQNSLTRIVLQSDCLAPRSLFFDSSIGYLSKAEFVSNLPPVHTKPFSPAPRNAMLHL